MPESLEAKTNPPRSEPSPATTRFAPPPRSAPTRRERLRAAAVNAGIVVATLVLACFGLEVVSRLISDPIDFMTPALIRDERLGYRIAPNSGGHDAWGFRNRTVPAHADIVAIGDSTTYGVAAPSTQSWPAWLASLSQRSVYNLGISGYGPVEYAKLAADEAPQLTPKVVVVGLYLGNDLRDAFISATGGMDPGIEQAFQPVAPILQVRRWLSHHSVLYGMAKAAFPTLVKFLRARVDDQRFADGVVEVDLWGEQIALTPKYLTRTMNTADDRIARGLARTRAEVRSIIEGSSAHGFKCYFLMIPTKESVVEPMIAASMNSADRQILQEITQLEDRIARSVEDMISELNVTAIDPLNAMRVAAREQAIYSPTDNHPNSAGYQAIAESVWKAIRRDFEADKMESGSQGG